MKSTIERTYSLGQYQNIKIQSEIDIPESDEVLEKLLKFDQLISLELVYMDYISLIKDDQHLDFENTLERLQTLSKNTKDKIYEYAYFSSIPEENEKEK